MSILRDKRYEIIIEKRKLKKNKKQKKVKKMKK